jgi:hypothetical protein
MIDRALRRAAVVTTCGLAFELFAAVHWSPATFVLSAAVGVPLVLLGAAMFLRTVWRLMKERGAA